MIGSPPAGNQPAAVGWRWRLAAWLRNKIAGHLSSGLAPDADPELLQRVRAVNLTGLVMIVFGLAWVGSFFSHGEWTIGLALCGLLLAYVSALLLLRWLRKPLLVAHLLLAILLVGATLSNYYTGGIARSNEVAYFLVPVLAIFLAGRQGLWWVVATGLVMGGMTWLEYHGHRFPQILPAEDRFQDAILVWLSALVVVAGVTYLYDRNRHDSARRLLAAKDRAERANRIKSQFLANMSHELRTPLNAIIGLTEITLQQRLADEQRHHLTMVKSSAYSLLALVDGVLDVSRLEAGRLWLRSELLDPRRTVAEVVEQERHRADEKGLELTCTFAPQLPSSLVGDCGRLRQVIANLLDNALKFTDRGWVRLTLSWEAAIGLVLEVADSGPGIDPAVQPRVFESFYQGDATSRRRHSGSGLGLAICQELVDLMGGRLALASQPGQGSRFRVELPLQPIAAADGDSRHHRILAAEDDRLGRELIATILQGAGYRVDLVADGRQAIDAFRDHRYDLVLMDIQMPGMDGVEATRQLRHLEAEDEHTPVLALTAYALEQERERCFSAGMDDFIVKPIEPDGLLRSIGRWLEDENRHPIP